MSCGLCLASLPDLSSDRARRVCRPAGASPPCGPWTPGRPVDATFARLMQTCVQCRACETACPASVPFGRLMEAAREALAPHIGASLATGRLPSARIPPGRWSALTTAGAVAQRAGLIPRPLARRLSLPRLPLRQPPLVATGDDVWLFTGCVMDAWQRSIHRAAIAVLGACGAGVALPGPGAACCGALHVHAGLRAGAARLARRVMSAVPRVGPDPGRLRRAAGRPCRTTGTCSGRGRRSGSRLGSWTSTSGWRAGPTDCRPRSPEPRGCASRCRIPATCVTCSEARRRYASCWNPMASWSNSTTRVAVAAPAAHTAPYSPSSPARSGPRSWR